MNPDLYERLGNDYEWDVDFAGRVTSRVLNYFCIRRRQQSMLKHADDKVTYPAAELTDVEIRTEELQYDPETAALVQEHGLEMASKLFMQGSSGDVPDFTPSKATGTVTGSSQAIV